MKIANAAHRSIGASTSNPRQVSPRYPQYALTVSRIFTNATNQKLMPEKDPGHVLSTAHLWRSLSRDKRFEQVPMNEVASGDIIIASHSSDANGYAGIAVERGRIVSDSSRWVGDNSSLQEVQRTHSGINAFRYIGVWNSHRKNQSLTNTNYNADEARIPIGQPGGGEWTDGLTEALLSKKDASTDSLTRRLEGDKDTAIGRGKNLPLDTSYKAGKRPNRNGVYITHYGPGKKVGGWDKNSDSNTDAGKGNHNNKLNHDSLAISDDIAKKAGIKPGDPVYVNGQYLGNYDDRAPEHGRIDIYDPLNSVKEQFWGGMLWGATVSNHP